MEPRMFSILRRGARPALGAALLLCMAGAGAQMFKWVDAKGVVHYSDSAPPDQKKTEVKTTGAAAGTVALPYALAQAARNHPVTLYTTGACAACDQARALLRARGIPFAEKTVNSSADQQKLREAGSDGQLPLLLVGRSKLVGFEAGAWGEALSDAAYPLRSMLPATWRHGAPEAAAPARADAAAAPVAPERATRANEAAVAAEKKRAEAARRDNPKAPPGFQF